jgi:hypothetical protein
MIRPSSLADFDVVTGPPRPSRPVAPPLPVSDPSPPLVSERDDPGVPNGREGEPPPA